MTWVRLDDRFFMHPKVVRAGNMAAWLWIASIGYAAANLTDGFIPCNALPLLSETMGKARDKAVAKLVECRLWEPCEGGWKIHDYLEWNPSSEEVKTQRSAVADRVAKHRAKKSEERRNGSGNALPPHHGNGDVTPPPIPIPIPIPPREANASLPPRSPAGGLEGGARLGDLEEVSSLHPAEVLATLREASRGKISTATDSRGEAALAEVLRDLQSRAPVGESLTLSTFRTLGEWAEAGGLAWWKGNGRPGVRYLLAPGTLAKHLDEASTWLRAGRPSLSEQGPREPQGSGTPDPWAGPNITDLRLAKQRAAKAAKETVNG